MDIAPEPWEAVLRILAAAGLGAVLGWERETAEKPAGLRTHMMVAMGAAAFTLTSLFLFEQVAAANPKETNLDPIRVVEGVVGGIGFLGAGAIIQSRGSVEGLTTAATIWVTGGIGAACAIGSIPIAATIVVAGVFILRVVPRIGNALGADGNTSPNDAEE